MGREVFTRFGARLEAGMETILRRGRVLREILKQDRLSPLSIELQMAWLVAFNDGLFDELDPDEVPARLGVLEQRVRESVLGLDDDREEWAAAVHGWLRT